jgi:hypothetical protein
VDRRNDKIVQIRIAWLEMCIDIYKNYPALVPQLIGKKKIATIKKKSHCHLTSPNRKFQDQAV